MTLDDVIQKTTPEGYTLSGRWTYHDASGNFAMEVARYNTTIEGKRPKEYRPFISDNNDGYVSKFPSPRPLYNLDKIVANPKASFSYRKVRRAPMLRPSCFLASW